MASQDAELFSPDLVFFDIEAQDRHELFQKLSEMLEKKGLIKPSWFGAIEEREANYATGLHFDNIEVAIPHVDPDNINRPYIAVIKPNSPIEFEHMAGAGPNVNAQVIMNLGVERDGGQVAVLQTLMNIFMDEGKSKEILAQDTPDGMVEVLTRFFNESA